MHVCKTKITNAGFAFDYDWNTIFGDISNMKYAFEKIIDGFNSEFRYWFYDLLYNKKNR